MRGANANGLHVVRMLQEEILFNKFDWITPLKYTIDRLLQETTPRIIYIENPAKNSLYQIYRDKMKS